MITSRDNQKLKFTRSVRDGREREYIFLEGARLAEEGLRSGLEIADILVSESFEKTDRHADEIIVADKVFDSITDTKSSQGIVVIAKKPATSIDRIEGSIARADGIPVVLFLQEINNPSNLGAIMRTAEAAGAQGIIVSKGSVDPFSPKSLRAGMGSNLRLPVCEGIDLAGALEWAYRRGMITTAADINGTKAYTSIDWKAPRLLVFGSEAHGLTTTDREKIKDVVDIPMSASVESLNIAVACGIVLFEARRQVLSISSDLIINDLH